MSNLDYAFGDDYKKRFDSLLELFIITVENEAQGLAHLNSGNVAHEVIAMKCNMIQYSKLLHSVQDKENANL